jgi:hypothetical protein
MQACHESGSRKPRNYAAKRGVGALENGSSNPPSSAPVCLENTGLAKAIASASFSTNVGRVHFGEVVGATVIRDSPRELVDVTPCVRLVTPDELQHLSGTRTHRPPFLGGHPASSLHVMSLGMRGTGCGDRHYSVAVRTVDHGARDERRGQSRRRMSTTPSSMVPASPVGAVIALVRVSQISVSHSGSGICNERSSSSSVGNPCACTGAGPAHDGAVT